MDKMIYTNNSAKDKIKSVHMYDKDGIYISSFDSIADATRNIIDDSDNFDSLCACISSVCHNKGVFVKNKYRFSFDKLDQLPSHERSKYIKYKVKQIFNDNTFKI